MVIEGLLQCGSPLKKSFMPFQIVTVHFSDSGSLPE